MHVRGEIAGGRVLYYECSANREREKGNLRRIEEGVLVAACLSWRGKVPKLRLFVCSRSMKEGSAKVLGTASKLR